MDKNRGHKARANHRPSHPAVRTDAAVNPKKARAAANDDKPLGGNTAALSREYNKPGPEGSNTSPTPEATRRETASPATGTSAASTQTRSGETGPAGGVVSGKAKKGVDKPRAVGADAAASKAAGGAAHKVAGGPAKGDALGQATDASAEKKEVPGASSDSEAIRVLGRAMPSQALNAVAASRNAASSEILRDRASLKNNPPSLDAPSGLAPPGAGGEGPEPLSDAVKAATKAAKLDEQEGEGGEPEKADIAHEVAEDPVPEGPSPEQVVNNAPDDLMARARRYQQMIAAMPTSDEVNTYPGPPRPVELTGEADPGQVSRQAKDNEVKLGAEADQAKKGMQEDEGVDDIYPTLPDEVLNASVPGGTANLPPTAMVDQPTLRPDVQAGMDAGLYPRWSAEVVQASSDHVTAMGDRKRSEAEERAASDREIAALEAGTVAEQRGHRDQADADVAAARTNWQSDIDAARGTYDGKQTKVQTDLTRKVDARVKLAEGEAQGHLDAGQRKAETKKRLTESEAERRRAEAERKRDEADGFLDWLSSKVKSFFKKLKEGLKKLFNALRDFVRKAIEAAKKLADAAIELGRKAVVGLVRAAGSALEFAADVFLAAFPEARAKAKALIRKGTKKCEEAVNNAAAALRKAVHAALDALGAALIFILDVYEKFYTMMLDAAEFLAVGFIEVTRALNRLDIAANHAPHEFEGQMYEQMIGADLTEPLVFEATPREISAWEAEMARGGSMPGASPVMSDAANDDMSAIPTDVVAEPVIGFDPEPDLIASHDFDRGPAVFGENDSPDNTIAALYTDAMGGDALSAEGDTGVNDTSVPGVAGPETGSAADDAATGAPGSGIPGETTDEKLDYYINQPGPKDCRSETPTKPEGPPMPLSAKIGPLTKGQRAKYMLAQAWSGIKHWVKCNWPILLAAILAAIVVVAGIVAVTVLTGGTAGAALTVLLTAFTGAMIIYAITQVAGFLMNYLTKSIAGDVVGGAKGLAAAFAVAAVEIVFAILTYITAGAFRLIAASIKGAGRLAAGAAKGAGKLAAGAAKRAGSGAKAIGKGATRVGRGAGRTLGRAGRGVARAGGAVVRRGKLVVRNVKAGFERGAKNLKELGRRLGKRLRFKKFKIERSGRWFKLYGQINPWVLLATGKVKKIKADDLPAGAKVGDTVPLGRGAKGVIIGQSKRAGKTIKSKAVKKIQSRRMSTSARQRLHRSLRGKSPDEVKKVLGSAKQIDEAAANLKATKDVGPTGVNKATWYHKPGSGELKKVKASLKRTHKVKRSSAETTAQGKVGKAGSVGDEGGHAVGHRFMGDQGIKNLFSQSGRFNKSAWKKLENEWADWIKKGYHVDLEINFTKFSGKRPGRITVKYKVTNPGTKVSKSFKPVPFDNIPTAIYNRIQKAAMTH